MVKLKYFKEIMDLILKEVGVTLLSDLNNEEH